MTGAAANVVQFGFGELEFRSAKGPFGVYWCLIPTPPDFELSVDWMTSDPDDNSGVFIRFPDPDRAPPKKDFAFTEPGYVATEYGFELQIDNARGGDSPPEGFVDPRFRGTGAFYNEPTQTMQDVAGLGPNQWHTYIIKARGLQFDVDVRVNGGPARPLTSFTFNEANYEPNDVRGNPHRGLPSQPGAERYIGLQLHDKTKLVKYRNIFIKPI